MTLKATLLKLHLHVDSKMIQVKLNRPDGETFNNYLHICHEHIWVGRSTVVSSTKDGTTAALVAIPQTPVLVLAFLLMDPPPTR